MHNLGIYMLNFVQKLLKYANLIYYYIFD